jgi:hypothetical protein
MYSVAPSRVAGGTRVLASQGAAPALAIAWTLTVGVAVMSIEPAAAGPTASLSACKGHPRICYISARARFRRSRNACETTDRYQIK